MLNECLCLSHFGSNYSVVVISEIIKVTDLFAMDKLSFLKMQLSINFEICFEVVFEWSNIIIVFNTAADCIPNHTFTTVLQFIIII